MKQNKQQEKKSFGTSGWTPKELETLEKLVDEYGTDRSKVLRQLVRNVSQLQAQVIDKLEKAGN